MTPGIPRQTGHTLVFGSLPKVVGQPQNALRLRQHLRVDFQPDDRFVASPFCGVRR